MVRKAKARHSYRLRAAQSFADRLNQRELEYITDRHAEAGLSSMHHEEFASIAARLTSRIAFIRRQIAFEDVLHLVHQHPDGNSNPRVFPISSPVVSQ